MWVVTVRDTGNLYYFESHERLRRTREMADQNQRHGDKWEKVFISEGKM